MATNNKHKPRITGVIEILTRINAMCKIYKKITAQDISMMICNDQGTVIFRINNDSYTIKVEIHDGSYNVIKNWNYTGLVDAIHNGDAKCWTTTKVFCEEELIKTIETAARAKKY